MADVDYNKISRQWAKENKKRLAYTFCDTTHFPPEDKPVTIFMAGTPGAGKTEFSKSLLELFDKYPVRIDADEIREMMRPIGYNGANSMLYQTGVGDAVNNLYRRVIKQHQSVIIDGTFAYGNWRTNIDMSLADKRLVEIYYLYQDPQIAWGYVKKRETQQGRSVPKEVFVKDYIASIENVCEAKKVY